MNTKDLKLIVKEKYNAIADQSKLPEKQQGCCGETGCCGEPEFSMIGDNYANLTGYIPDADLGLGCGLPTEFADLEKGDNVLDLGSGAGNDCFVARIFVGETGSVTGLDFSKKMLEKANANLKKTEFKNVNFIFGDIDNMPFENNTFDVIISNCVLNLVPEKENAFAEIYRVLKPNGHFCISDVIVSGKLPMKLLKAVELYAGCVTGALLKEDYLAIVEKQGFTEIKVETQKPIPLPIDVLRKYLTEDEIVEFNNSGAGIFSITVTAKK